MKPLQRQIRALVLPWAAKGGKTNRRQQRRRIEAFAAYAASQGAQEVGQVGARHVIRYWKARRDLADTTLYSHWRALCVLWSLSGKDGMPPKPRFSDQNGPKE